MEKGTRCNKASQNLSFEMGLCDGKEYVSSNSAESNQGVEKLLAMYSEFSVTAKTQRPVAAVM